MAVLANAIETKLRKYEAIACAATKQLQESGLGELEAVASWDSSESSRASSHCFVI